MSTPNLFEIRDDEGDLLQVGRMGGWAIIAITINIDEPEATGICLHREERLRIAEILTGDLLAGGEGARTFEDTHGNVLEVRLGGDEVLFQITPAADTLLDFQVLISREDVAHVHELLTR